MAEFIATEGFGGPGEAGEARVFEAVKAAYAGEEALGFWRYPLVTRQTVREPDILIADPELGLVVIEIKSLPLDMIGSVTGYHWNLTRPYYGKTALNPYQQAHKQAQVLGEMAVRKSLATRAVVAVPLIARNKRGARFGQLLSDVPMLFADQLTPAKVRRALEQTPPVRYGEPLDNEGWLALCSALGTSGRVPKRQVRHLQASPESWRKIDLIARCARHLHAFDLQQELIGKTVPLAQKAADMHLGHLERRKMGSGREIQRSGQLRSLHETNGIRLSG